MRAGDFIFVSGQVAKDEQRQHVRRQHRGGDALDDRVPSAASWRWKAPISPTSCKVTVYLEDARDFGRYNRVFAEYFPEGRVARTTVEARAVIECKIEMDAIAYKPKA